MLWILAHIFIFLLHLPVCLPLLALNSRERFFFFQFIEFLGVYLFYLLLELGYGHSALYLECTREKCAIILSRNVNSKKKKKKVLVCACMQQTYTLCSKQRCNFVASAFNANAIEIFLWTRHHNYIVTYYEYSYICIMLIYMHSHKRSCAPCMHTM